jgi:hypothetical protein
MIMLTKLAVPAILALAVLASGSQAMAQTMGLSTGPLNRDTPTGNGDYENAAALVTGFECVFVANGQPTNGALAFPSANGYVCNKEGSICRNTAAVACQDTKVKFTFDDLRGRRHTTQWIDRDDPSGDGDWENFSQIFTAKCTFTGTSNAVTPITANGPYRCGNPDSRTGAIAINALNGGQMVRDVTVEFTY